MPKLAGILKLDFRLDEQQIIFWEFLLQIWKNSKPDVQTIKVGNAKQQCIKVYTFTGEAPLIIE